MVRFAERGWKQSNRIDRPWPGWLTEQTTLDSVSTADPRGWLTLASLPTRLLNENASRHVDLEHIPAGMPASLSVDQPDQQAELFIDRGRAAAAMFVYMTPPANQLPRAPQQRSGRFLRARAHPQKRPGIRQRLRDCKDNGVTPDQGVALDI